MTSKYAAIAAIVIVSAAFLQAQPGVEAAGRVGLPPTPRRSRIRRSLRSRWTWPHSLND